MMHLGYLMEYRKGTYTTLLTSCKLNEYLAEINEEAARMFVSLIEEMTESEGITEQLKADNQMEWVQRMNSIRCRAAETVNRLIIYA